MAQEQTPPSGPDLTKGVGLDDFVDDKLLGHVGDEEVLLVRSGGDMFAVGAHCSHYHGPLADGLVVGESVRCPWHHACFDLRTGEAVRAPALSPIDCWKVEQRDGRIFVTQKREQPKPRAMAAKADTPNKIVIVGGGAAGFAAAEMLRRRGYRRQHRHGEQRRRAAGRSAQSVQGLSRRQRAGGLAAAAAGRFLCRKQDRPAARRRGHRDRYQSAPSPLRRWRDLAYDRLLLATGAEPVRLPFPAPICRMFIRCARSPTAAPSSPTPKARSAWS